MIYCISNVSFIVIYVVKIIIFRYSHCMSITLFHRYSPQMAVFFCLLFKSFYEIDKRIEDVGKLPDQQP